MNTCGNTSLHEKSARGYLLQPSSQNSYVSKTNTQPGTRLNLQEWCMDSCQQTQLNHQKRQTPMEPKGGKRKTGRPKGSISSQVRKLTDATRRELFISMQRRTSRRFTTQWISQQVKNWGMVQPFNKYHLRQALKALEREKLIAKIAYNQWIYKEKNNF